MFSEHLREYAESRFSVRMEYLGAVRKEIQEGLSGCSQDEAVCMKFLYGTMPLRDAGEYSFDVFYSFVKHSVWLRENVEWCRRLPEDVFVHYVLYYRINSEDISDHRCFFYSMLNRRIEGLGMKEAVLEINYWCAENATYESSDNRTISPLTVFRSGKGRCGEESTFAVSAFRSVGIPARQVYTPRWAHCDDNHAWVEVYLEGEWFFLGACEPEEVLNKGWFSNASSRALLVHSRTFSDFVNETREECIGREDLLIYYNNTSTYARTRLLTICVTDREGRAAAGAEVSVEILNMAEFCSVSTLTADSAGEVRITIGLGDICVRAFAGMWFGTQMVKVAETDRAVIVLDHCAPGGGASSDLDAWCLDRWEHLDVEAPVDYPMHPVVLTEEQKKRKRERLGRAGQMREERTEGYFREELAAGYPEETEMLHLAKGNFDEVYAFLSRDSNPDRRALLHSLTIKDFKDVKREVLESHLDTVRGDWEQAFYEEYILCPRIYFEEMTSYRPFIQEYFTREEKESFSREPEKIWKYIQEKISFVPELDYKTICSTPVGALRLKQGNELSRKILFVAICRTLGVPARVNKVTVCAEYYKDGGFAAVGQAEEASAEAGRKPEDGQPEACTDCGKGPEKASLLFTVEDGSKWTYYQTWTIGSLTGARFTTLDYEGLKFDGNHLELALEEGIYRLVTTSRMPNGNQHASLRTFVLGRGEKKEIAMILREGLMEDLLVSNEIADFNVWDREGNSCSMSRILKDKGVVAFLEEGAEPTEHVLNEMILASEEWNKLPAATVFIVRGEDALLNRTLKKALDKVKNVQVFFDPEGENAEPVARRMYVDPEKLPLLVVTSQGMTGIYGCSGYNVGSVDLMMKILKR